MPSDTENPLDLESASSSLQRRQSVDPPGEKESFLYALQQSQSSSSSQPNKQVQFPHPHPKQTNPNHDEEPSESMTHKSVLRQSESSGLDDPFMPREGRDLVWKSVNMTLNNPSNKNSDDCNNNNKPKKILDNVWGEVPKRQVTAIMGPSGSGKTSLLNILAGRTKTNGMITVTADVRLNNYIVDPTNMDVRKKVAFVAQDDSLQVTATPREAILFSAKLRLPASMTQHELISLTDRMIRELGLDDCANTVVGGSLVKGLSGGERKRTSVGVELVTRPALVFLDEPTSGLDSFNAVLLCQLLKKVANAGSSVLFTIHQPSSEIFSSFDRLILLNKGRVMYQGSIEDVTSFFSQRGHPNPPNYNPADWIMNVALSHSIDQLNQAGYFPADHRDIGEPFVAADGKDVLGMTRRSYYAEHRRDGATVGIATQAKLLFQREVTNLVRATHPLKARTAMTIMISLVIGCIFYRVAKTSFAEFINVQSCFGALLMALLANVFSTAIPSLIAFPDERPVFLREYSTNHYSVFAYFASRLLMELFVTGAQVTVSSIITYFLVGFSAQYGYFWSGLYLMACASTGTYSPRKG